MSHYKKRGILRRVTLKFIRRSSVIILLDKELAQCPFVVPIPGTTKEQHQEASNVALVTDELKEINR